MGHTDPRVPVAASRTDVLTGVAELFREILGLDEAPDADGDFFDSGGNSILGARLVVMLRRDFDVKVTIRDVFGSRTVGAIAVVVEQHGQPR